MMICPILQRWVTLSWRTFYISLYFFSVGRRYASRIRRFDAFNINYESVPDSRPPENDGGGWLSLFAESSYTKLASFFFLYRCTNKKKTKGEVQIGDPHPISLSPNKTPRNPRYFTSTPSSKTSKKTPLLSLAPARAA